jgi:hypothetical protein
VDPSRVRNGLVNPWSNLVKLREMCPGPSSWGYLTWRVLIESGWFGLGCLVLRADARENPGGKNGVMTVAHSLFGVSWDKERQTKNK